MDLFLYEFGASSAEAPPVPVEGVFEMKTCQRILHLSPFTLGPVVCRRQYQGAEAYAFLLRFACGLESEIKGETDVFGQVKNAFKNFKLSRPDQAVVFQPLFLKIFEDTKDIRAGYLHGIGGNTYGALARRLLAPLPSDQVVILGAGQISKSVAPYFAESKLTVFNRSLGRLLELTSELAKKGYHHINFIQDDASLHSALLTADLIILGTPAESELDQKVISFCTSKNLKAKILHLGAQAPDLAHFQNEPALADRFGCLSDLFAMEKEQNIFREKQVAQAMEACRHRAILRSMARSISISHGWEDLALFS